MEVCWGNREAVTGAVTPPHLSPQTSHNHQTRGINMTKSVQGNYENLKNMNVKEKAVQTIELTTTIHHNQSKRVGSYRCGQSAAALL